ncbi:calcium/sodium antiporter [Ornithinimicrobium pratense]|uniref:Calcium/sodium antiporter n=1 Tax=Ornithinimicrobium pratense TaxID=2593973 RepID=A0A5J6V3T5_9MICO|nr:calcium/sodium antiporter [Ornithinimicrobium pratense]QFG67623.1 calcium/sodium antiporter [Ornithinimicrobium pratense]
MELLDVGRIVLGVVLLVGGAELLVRGAASLAVRAGMSSLVVGLTVVAAATSTPELAVTLGAVLDGETGLAIGNVVGSNIANILLILGASALIAPLAVRRVLVRMDIPYLIGLAILTLFFALDGRISRLEGGILLLLLGVHTALALWLSRRDGDGQAGEGKDAAGREPPGEPTAPRSPGPGQGATATKPRSLAKGPWQVVLAAYRNPGVLVAILLVVVGVGLLVLGARVLVTGAVNIASAMGVSGLVIGLTVVAIGTSLPELATSLIAALRGERDIAVGNIVGSCIFNLGLVLGLPALLAPGGGLEIPGPAIALDIPLMIAATVALAPVAFTGYRVGRREGGLFMALYIAYVGFVVLDATRHDALEGFTTVMVVLVLPLVLLTLVGTVAFDLGRRKERKAADAGQDDEIDRAWRT